MVSWMAAKASLQYFLAIFHHLLKLTVFNQLTNLLICQRKDRLDGFLEPPFLIITETS